VGDSCVTDPECGACAAHFVPVRDQEADAAFVHSSHGPHATPRSHGTSSPLAHHSAHTSVNLG
jgi:hypothetical protein